MALKSDQSDVPRCYQSVYSQPGNFFHHLAFASSAVAGDRLWIHGGEIALWNCTGNGTSLQFRRGHILQLPNNATFSKDLSSSWDNSSFSLNSIEHAKAPALIAQTLWVDPAGSFLYAYDGGLSGSSDYTRPEVPPNQLWKFGTSAESGDWSLVNPSASSNFSDLVRTYYGTYTYGNGFGFALGGFIADSSTLGGAVTPGLVIYNITSQNWYNVSALGYSQSGASVNGAAHFVPSFGPAGLLFVLGGSIGNRILPGLDEIYMFDPISQQWSAQKASGTQPSAATWPCVVGAQGDNDTYELFFYGGNGNSNEDTIANGAVYVLSLPAFHWQKQDGAPKYGRWGHSCNVIGKRQMVSIGGLVIDSTMPQLDTASPADISFDYATDPWQQGIGVFDMSAMQWTDGYDSTAAPYITPDMVKTYYQQNGREPASWSNDIVKAWFTRTESNTTGSAPHNSGTAGQTGSPKSSEIDTGAIVGGTVGGVAAVVVIALLMIFFLRRRSHRAPQQAASPLDPMRHDREQNNQKFGFAPLFSEVDGKDAPRELSRRDQIPEVNGDHNVYEAP